MNINILDYKTEELFFKMEDVSAAQVSSYSNAKYILMDGKEFNTEAVVMDADNNTLIVLVS